MSAIDLRETALAHLDHVLAEWKRLAAGCKKPDCEDLGDADGTRFVTRALAVVRRVAGTGSAYDHQAEAIATRGGYVGYVARHIVGVVDSLRVDVAAGFLGQIAQLIHGEVFADFLEMAQHLLDENYKDAAAVIAGSSLEAHLRQLCVRHGVALEVTAGSSTRPKKAEQMNSDLAGANAYSKLDQKSVTAWLDLRNNAAHGRYGEYQAAQVTLLISGIRDFVTRTPA
jgi:hypothetical protein